ncbi:ABC transporter ATP-binding protein [Geothrix sp. PMB-07]|uniref:ABC transporter ATP-binding protein n=1 Tax=Geothrix sp. PMB-07 TaxID=3068640 RepID=UPI00274043D1|nr:ABC transporter ATP-binding protein [Geothrix sp. PMB-07]WLT31448.1 ABC transporter ATP-binding protein [Geothrix sp. PMB-07]
MPALQLDSLTKRFGEKTAVDGLNLSLEAGAFLGLLGRNGAGKSTTLKMVTGLLTPTSGSIHVLGLDLAKEPLAVKRQIGAMPEDMALLDMLSGPQYLRFVGRMYGMPDALIDQRREELFDKLDLSTPPKTLIADYSFGMKKKVALCAALIHAPRMVFLDEPFEGIDPVTSRTIKDILHSLQQSGVTLVLTSHILEVVERLCPLIAILDEGRIKGFGPLEELRRGGESLEQLFVDLVGGAQKGALSWL